MRWFNILLDILFPEQPVCLFCNRRADSDINFMCRECLQKISFFELFCEHCGRHLPYRKKRFCRFCLQEKPGFDRARACALYYGGLKEYISDFKYRGQTKLARGFGFLMSEYYREFFGELEVAGVLSIPLHKKKRRERGFNQAELLAKELCQNLSLPSFNGLLVRKKETPPLYELNHQQRRQAVRGAFALTKTSQFLRNKTLLLVDDILTTGSTVNEAARLLKQVGKADTIIVLTLATGTVPEK